MRALPLILGLLAAGILHPAGAQEKAKPKDEAPGEYEEKIVPLLSKYCFKCHGPEKKKGDLDLSSFKTSAQVAGGLEIWQKALERINAFEMPPEKCSQPSHDE